MIALFNYNESPIQFEEINGQVMANATLMCKAFGKRPADWLKTEQTQRYMKALASTRKIVPADLHVVRNGGMDYGTWIDEKLVLNLARWLDVEFEIWCDECIAELSRNGYVGNVPALPVAEIAEMKELLTKQSAELSEIKALLDQRIIRSNRPTPREESALSQQEKDQIVAFWDALNESKSILLKKEHWTVDHEYLYISLPKMMPYYEPYCMRHELDFINAGDLKDVLLSGRYAPYVASTQKGTHNSHKKAGFGRCYRFRYEVRDNELFIGDKKITFARLQ